MLAHPHSHPQQQQQQQQPPPPQQHQQSVSQSSMSYNVQVNSAHKNISSSSTSTGAYSIQNMKEEPNAGANNYSNAVNGNGADDMAVSCSTCQFSKILMETNPIEVKTTTHYDLFFAQSFGLFQHPGAYDEQEYHSLSQDAQNQPPFLENSPEFYAGMLEQKYNQPYHKNPFNSRGRCSVYITISQIRFAEFHGSIVFLVSLCNM